jgi:hypothetical protein
MNHLRIGKQWQILQCICLTTPLTFSARATEPQPMGTLSGKVVDSERHARCRCGPDRGVILAPVGTTSGWVGLWAMRRPRNTVNSPVLRGRTVVGDAIPYANAAIHDGSYHLEVPFQSESWYVVVQELGHPLTQVGPVSIALKEQKSLPITCTQGGRIRGRVTGIPAGWEGHARVLAFSKTAVQAEVRVDPNGQFTLPSLPPGEYGLKAGHDAYDDAEYYPGKLAREHPESFNEMADPWKRAKFVTVRPGRDSVIVEVEFPR